MKINKGGRMESVSSWAQGIIVAVIVGTIIEMILPKSSNSKYVKVVIGIFVLFSIVVPVIGKMYNNKIDANSIINLSDYDIKATSSNISAESIEEQKSNQIINIYKENLQLDIQSKVQVKGYKTDSVLVEISNDDNYTINKIEFKVIEKNQELLNEKKVTSIVDNIESVKINLSNNKKNTDTASILTEKEKSDLRQYLCDTYEIKKENVCIL